MAKQSWEPIRDPHLGVVALLLAAAGLGAGVSVAVGLAAASPASTAAGAATALAAGMLAGTGLAGARRAGVTWAERVSPALLRLGVAGVGLVASASASGPPGGSAVAGAVAGLGALGAGVAARYLAAVDPAALPEAPGLASWGRALAWLHGAAAVATGLAAVGLDRPAEWVGTSLALFSAALVVDVASGGGALGDPCVWRSGTRVLDLSFTRFDPFASLFDRLDQGFGIDVRSTWALAVIRGSVEPLAVGVGVAAWASTAVTVVQADEAGVVARFGVPVDGPPLAPGLHVHLPWPADRVTRTRVRLARTVPIGHDGGEEEGEEAGPEDVLWAQQHAAKEYTLVLGDGRDLVTIDAAVHYRISDPVAWHYGCQNPELALRAVSYRAVMDRTVDRTLAEVLSENVAKLTTALADDAQRGADALGLGVEVLGFTVGGMHPPVPVARDYQAVVSAQIAQETAAIDARAYAERVVPSAAADAEALVLAARADGARAIAGATGESAGFLVLDAAYRVDPAEFRYRRRLEALEKSLAGKRLTILDHRLERDGAELWQME